MFSRSIVPDRQIYRLLTTTFSWSIIPDRHTYRQTVLLTTMFSWSIIPDRHTYRQAVLLTTTFSRSIVPDRHTYRQTADHYVQSVHRSRQAQLQTDCTADHYFSRRTYACDTSSDLLGPQFDSRRIDRSGYRFRVPRCRTTRCKSSSIPTAIQLHNQLLQR